jgi:low temperature requirement protein LtrA
MDNEHTSGWLTFSSIILVFAGIMKLFDSIWAFRVKGNIEAVLSDATFGSNAKTYGWLWLLFGILLIVAGFGVLIGSQLGRWFGIVAAAIAAIGTMAWMPYFSVWALTYVVLAILVIYGLAVHGGLEMPRGVAPPDRDAV